MTRRSLRVPGALLAAALLLAGVCTIGSPVLAAEGTLPGMCNGRTDSNINERADIFVDGVLQDRPRSGIS